MHKLKTALALPWQRMLYIMFFAELITAVGFSTVNPFLPLYVKSLGATSNLSIEILVGLVFSAQSFAMMIAAPVWGMVADRHGRKLMVERAMFGGAVLMLLMAFVRSAEEIVLLRAIQGLVTGTVGAASALVAAAVPRERSGYAMGLLQVGFAGGLALGPLIGGAVADAYGYSVAFYVTTALLIIAGVMVLLGVDEKFMPASAIAGARAGFISEWRHILATPGVGMNYMMRFLNNMGRSMIIPIAPLFILTLMSKDGQVNTITGLVVGISSATSSISAVFLGRLGDKVGHRRILIACTFISALLYLPQSLVTTSSQLLVLQALAGFALGGIVTAISALLVTYIQPGEEGAAYGLDTSVGAGARAIGPLLASGLALWFDLRATFVGTAILYLLAGILASWRLPRARESKEPRANKE